MRPPFFIIGSPRSGTTFLVEVLQRHPGIFVTNETRVMTYLNRILNRVGQNSWVLSRHRDAFLDLMKRELPRLVETFYRELGAKPDGLWGDKNPHYADSKMDPECLDLIDELFPQSRFIHVLRDGRDVVCSIVRKKWAPFPKALDVWTRHVRHARSFGERVGPERYLEVRLEALYEDDVAQVRRLLEFLGMDMTAEVSEFLDKQRTKRTPFSGATSDVGEVREAAWKEQFPPKKRRTLEDELGPLLVETGYEDAQWWARRGEAAGSGETPTNDGGEGQTP